MAAIWAASWPRVQEQLDVLDRAAQALTDGTLHDELKREAEREAHRLAGSTGSFGFKSASPLALELEGLFQIQTPDPEVVSRLVRALRQELEASPPA